MTDEEITEWASTYIQAQLDPNLIQELDHPQWWAVEKFINIGSDEASMQDCFKAILRILALKPPKNVLGILAAGPLEDLIENYGNDVIEEIESEARRNPAFRNLLGGVWESSTKEIWARIEACRGVSW